MGSRGSANGQVALCAASDTELAHALCRRQLAALDEAFSRHASQVAKTIRRIAGGSYTDDIVQEVFLRLWQAPERFDPERGSLATYLGVLARGRTLDALRSDGVWHRRNSERSARARPGDEVEDLVMDRVSAVELRMALRALPMAERVPIELAFFGGYTYQQVAVQLGAPEGTTKSRIRSGLRRLETALRGMEAGRSWTRV